MKFKKILIIWIIFLFLGTVINPSVAIKNIKNQSFPISSGNTLYVGGTEEGNYTHIQDAIDNATEGNTVFVYDDSSPYNEYLLIDKSINLVGEIKWRTIIKGDDEIEQHIIRITADGVNINGFTIQDCAFLGEFYGGIMVYSDNNSIYGNILTNNPRNLWFKSSSNNKIYNNIISKSKRDGPGIKLAGGRNNEIFNNIISEVGIGIDILESSSNSIYKNNISKTIWDGIHLYGIPQSGCYNRIYNNIITNAKTGIFLGGPCKLNFVYLNDIKSCRKYGCSLYETISAFIVKNNFHNNSCNAYFFSKSIRNLWIRNYWDDWNGWRSYKIVGKTYNWMDPEGEYVTVYQYDRLPAAKPFVV